MKPRRPAVSPEEQALFLAAVGGTTPLGTRDRLPIPPPPPSPVRVVELPPKVALTIEGDSARYMARAPGVSRAQVTDLRAGKVHAQATLDLHGQTVDAGKAQLREFLVGAERAGQRCVRIIHGKGTHSDHGAPLREAVLGELLGELSGLVRALATAAPQDGGEGATYVIVRSGK